MWDEALDSTLHILESLNALAESVLRLFLFLFLWVCLIAFSWAWIERQICRVMDSNHPTEWSGSFVQVYLPTPSSFQFQVGHPNTFTQAMKALKDDFNKRWTQELCRLQETGIIDGIIDSPNTPPPQRTGATVLLCPNFGGMQQSTNSLTNMNMNMGSHCHTPRQYQDYDHGYQQQPYSSEVRDVSTSPSPFHKDTNISDLMNFTNQANQNQQNAWAQPHPYSSQSQSRSKSCGNLSERSPLPPCPLNLSYSYY